MRAQEARFAALAATGRYPYFARLTRRVPDGFELDLDGLFELGLTALLDGFARVIEPAGSTPRRATATTPKKRAGTTRASRTR
jgi:hypothetical protein